MWIFTLEGWSDDHGQLKILDYAEKGVFFSEKDLIVFIFFCFPFFESKFILRYLIWYDVLHRNQMVYLLLVACYIRHYMYVCTMYIVQLCCCSGRDYWDIHWLHLQLWLPLYVTPNSRSPIALIQSSCYVLKHSFHADPISCWQCFFYCPTLDFVLDMDNRKLSFPLNCGQKEAILFLMHLICV